MIAPGNGLGPNARIGEKRGGWYAIVFHSFPLLDDNLVEQLVQMTTQDPQYLHQTSVMDLLLIHCAKTRVLSTITGMPSRYMTPNDGPELTVC